MRHTKTTLTILLPWTAAALSLTPVCELERPPEPTSLSSLSFVSNGIYWSSTDWQPTLYELRLDMPAGGRPANLKIAEKCRLEGAKDVEGVAYDPLRGTVWASDEVKIEVCEYDPATGRRIGKVDIPNVFRKCRPTFGFESLAIRPDGLEMWFANEEALSCDGPVSTSKTGAVVRIARFTRKDGRDSWHAAGQWAYRCDRMAGAAPIDACRSGLSALCVLEDGTMLALEREYSFKPLPSLRCRIYAVDRAGATDVSARESLAPGTLPFSPVAKDLLCDFNSGLAMYEGIAPGPVEPDGSRIILLVSDGDKMMLKRILALRLKK